MTKKKTLACLCVLAASALWGCVGVFVRVIKGGAVHPGDTIEITRNPTPEQTAEVAAYAAACVAAQKGAPFVA